MDLGRGDDASEDERAHKDDDDLIGDLWSEDGGSFKPEDIEEEREYGEDNEEKEDEEDNEACLLTLRSRGERTTKPKRPKQKGQ